MARKTCCEFDCSAPRYSLGRCGVHFKALPESEKARLRALPADEREAEFDSFRGRPPAAAPWEWEGNEQALIEMVEKQEKETAEATKGE